MILNRNNVLHFLEPLAIFLVALAAYSTNLHRLPIFDELYHVLAAQSWVTEGTFQIADGHYDRASAYTILIGWFFKLFGESLAVARLTSILAGSTLIALVYIWTRAVAGRAAAWITALALCFSPGAIAAAQHIRFYSLHALSVWLAAIGILVLFTKRFSASVTALLIVGTIASLALAAHLQQTTYIVLIGIGLWIILMLVDKASVHLYNCALRQWIFLMGTVMCLALALTFLLSDLGHGLIAEYRKVALWNAENRYAPSYYIELFISHYPTFFTLFPLASMVAITYRPEPATLSTSIFVSGLILFSFAGMKGLRYLYVITPFFFFIWGVALVASFNFLLKALSNLIDSAVKTVFAIDLSGTALYRIRLAVMALIMIFIVITNTAFPRAAKYILAPEPVKSNWQALSKQLALWIDEVEIMLTTEDINALYFLGRHDMFISATKLFELPVKKEFVLDPRTGRPIISTAESLRRVMACYSSGIIIAEEEHWRNPIYITDEIADLIIRHTIPVLLDKRLHMIAYRWEKSQQSEKIECDGLPIFAKSAKER